MLRRLRPTLPATRRARTVVATLLCGLLATISAGSNVASAGPTAAWPTGTLTLTDQQVTDCPSGFTCQSFSIGACPSVSQAARGEMATAAVPRPSGVVVLFSGSDGTTWWGTGSAFVPGFVRQVQSDGFEVVLVRWVDPWLVSAPGETAGTAHVACRPATSIRWIHDHVYAPLGLTPRPEHCGFCVSGNSGGASQVAYAVSFYGLGPMIDAVIPTSGPPHAGETKGCERVPSEQEYWYTSHDTTWIDDAWGYVDSPAAGPCSLHETSFAPEWNADSADTGANALVYPNTRVDILEGALDCTPAPAHGDDFFHAVSAAGSPFVELVVVANTSHDITGSQQGVDTLEQSLLDKPLHSSAAPCYPLP